jgi:hypothetical protein
MPRQAYAFTRYDAQSGVRIAITSRRWARGEATFAMYSATGNAITASMIVTPTAVSRVRTVIVRYTSRLKSSRKLSSVHVRSMLPVNPLAVHSAVMNSAASAPRYATPSHSMGGPRSSPSRSRG